MATPEKTENTNRIVPINILIVFVLLIILGIFSPLEEQSSNLLAYGPWIVITQVVINLLIAFTLMIQRKKTGKTFLLAALVTLVMGSIGCFAMAMN